MLKSENNQMDFIQTKFSRKDLRTNWIKYGIIETSDSKNYNRTSNKPTNQSTDGHEDSEVSYAINNRDRE